MKSVGNILLQIKFMDMLQIAEKRKTDWLKLARRWKGVYWVSGTLATLFSTLGSLEAIPECPRFPSRLFSVLATVLLGFIGFANPIKQFNRIIGAYKVLDAAILYYNTDKDERKLAEAIEKSEVLANPPD